MNSHRSVRRGLQASLVGLALAAPAAAQDAPAAAPAAPPAAASSETSTPVVAPSTTREQPHADAPPSSGMSDADLADLGMGNSDGAATTAAADLPVNVYGFADFSYYVPLMKKDNPWSSLNRYNQFAVGNINVYFAKSLSERCRSLLEVRFLYLPHGTETSTGGQHQSTSVGDPADFGRPLRWGGIEIERVQAECDIFNGLTLRAGQWLSPYGIWNVDHGTPTIIGVRRPFVIGEAVIPERQTGLMLFGRTFVGDIGIGYNVTLSNGRGPVDAYKDFDDNKAIGARLELRYAGFGDLRVGTSYYRGRYTDRIVSLEFRDGGEASTVAKPVDRYDEQAIATDLQWDISSVLLRAEYVYGDRIYRKNGRPMFQPGSYRANSRRGGYYILGGYRLPRGVTPYFLYQAFDWPEDGTNIALDSVWAIHAGLNYQLLPSLVLKGEYTTARVRGPIGALEKARAHMAEFQASWVF